MRLADMTYLEVADAAAMGAIAVLPTGCTEQQGPHLTVDFDSWFAEAVCVAAAEQVAATGRQAVVLPVLPYGPTPEHRNYGAGFVDIPKPLHEQFVLAILDSLADQGFRRIVVWRGCGGHDLVQLVNRFNIEREGSATAYLPASPFHDVWCAVADPNVPGGHADSFTTSIALYARARMVRRHHIPNGTSDEPDWADADLDFARYSSTGVVGTAAAADAETGALLWQASVDAVAREFLRVVDATQG